MACAPVHSQSFAIFFTKINKKLQFFTVSGAVFGLIWGLKTGRKAYKKAS